MHRSGRGFLLAGERAPWAVQAPSQIQTRLFSIVQLSYLQNLSSGPDVTLLPDSRGFEQKNEVLNNPDEIRLGHCGSDGSCGGRNPSVGQGPVLLGSGQMSCHQDGENRHSVRDDKDLSLLKLKDRSASKPQASCMSSEPEYFYSLAMLKKLLILQISTKVTEISSSHSFGQMTCLFFRVKYTK